VYPEILANELCGIAREDNETKLDIFIIGFRKRERGKKGSPGKKPLHKPSNLRIQSPPGQ
jgi:hypothetical protein